MLSRFAHALSKKLLCGFRQPPTLDGNGGAGGEEGTGAGESPPSQPPRIAVVEEPREGDAAGAWAEEDGGTAVPCVAFASELGYKVFSLAENRMVDDGDVRLRLAGPRRHVPSPYGGKVFVTELSGLHPSHLVDPFTGERTPLPDLPIPLSETEPTPCAAAFNPRGRHAAAAEATDDGFAWDWSPRGVMVARGDTAFFCEAGGAAWAPVHRSRRGSAMTVNHRGGLFFVLEKDSLLTTVIDAATLRRAAVIHPPPAAGNADAAALVASTGGDVLLLLHRAGDSEHPLFSDVYRARHRPGQAAPPAQWARVTDIGDRAVFLDGAHGFTVGAGDRAERNAVYVAVDTAAEGPSSRRRAVTRRVCVVHLTRPKQMVELDTELSGCEVERMWGEAHWIILNSGSS